MSDFLAKNLKYYRKLKKMTQAQLAEAVNVSEMSIRRYETLGKGNREPSYKTILSLCEILGIHPSDLIETTKYSHVSNNLTESLQNATIIKTENEDFEKLAVAFSKLNNSGQKKAVEQIDLLTKIPEYQKDSSDRLTVQAAHERTDIEVTDEMRQHDDDIMNDENF